MDATELCRVLLVGSVATADVPELGEPETRDEVRRRLGEAGCELVYSSASERWLARLDGAVPALEGHDPVLALGTAELAVLATCWLHLRFLPGEARSGDSQPEPDQDWLDPDDLSELLGARLDGGLPGVLERLGRAGYLTLREGGGAGWRGQQERERRRGGAGRCRGLRRSSSSTGGRCGPTRSRC
jgi:hypothetical protein